MFVLLFLDTDDRRYFSSAARAAIREVCEATEPQIRETLPSLAPSIELASSTGAFVIPETGEVGMAVSTTRVDWTVDPDREGGVEAIARSQLRYTLFHECHHLVRGHVVSNREARTSFMDWVVGEGLATAFERDFGGREPPWGKYPENVHSWVQELLVLPTGAPRDQWMFQHPDGRRWIGYRAGTYIADQAMTASGRSAADLVNAPTEEILELADLREGR